MRTWPGREQEILTGWSGDCTGKGACGVVMSKDRTVTATFGPIPKVLLTVTVVNSGSVQSSAAATLSVSMQDAP